MKVKELGGSMGTEISKNGAWSTSGGSGSGAKMRKGAEGMAPRELQLDWFNSCRYNQRVGRI